MPLRLGQLRLRHHHPGRGLPPLLPVDGDPGRPRRGGRHRGLGVHHLDFALLIVAVIGPPLGSLCDQTASKKRFLAFFAGLGVCASALFVLLGDDSYLTGSVLFIAGNIGFAAGNIFYESLLPHVARPGDLDRVSTRGYAMGYIGGGILLVVNLLWIMHPDWFLLPGTGFALRLTFFSVALWWAAFTVPLLRRVEEPRLPPARPEAGKVVAAFRRLASTFRQVRRYRQLLLFLAAFWLYNDGIGTIRPNGGRVRRRGRHWPQRSDHGADPDPGDRRPLYLRVRQAGASPGDQALDPRRPGGVRAATAPRAANWPRA